MIPCCDDIAEMIEERAKAILRKSHCTRDQALAHATTITSTLLLGDMLGFHIREGIDAAGKRVIEKDQN